MNPPILLGSAFGPAPKPTAAACQGIRPLGTGTRQISWRIRDRAIGREPPTRAVLRMLALDHARGPAEPVHGALGLPRASKSAVTMNGRVGRLPRAAGGSARARRARRPVPISRSAFASRGDAAMAAGAGRPGASGPRPRWPSGRTEPFYRGRPARRSRYWPRSRGRW